MHLSNLWFRPRQQLQPTPRLKPLEKLFFSKNNRGKNKQNKKHPLETFSPLFSVFCVRVFLGFSPKCFWFVVFPFATRNCADPLDLAYPPFVFFFLSLFLFALLQVWLCKRGSPLEYHFCVDSIGADSRTLQTAQEKEKQTKLKLRFIVNPVAWVCGFTLRENGMVRWMAELQLQRNSIYCDYATRQSDLNICTVTLNTLKVKNYKLAWVIVNSSSRFGLTSSTLHTHTDLTTPLRLPFRVPLSSF